MRILASNPDTIGDVILRQPLYAALHEAGHEILMVVRPQVKAIARLILPYSRLLELPLNPYTEIDDSWPGRLQPLFDQALAFRPDVLLVAPCQWTLFDEQLAQALDNVSVIGMTGWLYPGSVYDGQRFESRIRFTVQAQVERTQHELEKNQRLCETVLGRPVTVGRPTLSATEIQRYLARVILERHGWSPGNYWLASIGANLACRYSQLRNWREEKWVATLRHAIEKHGWRFVLVGLPEEQELSRRIRDALGAAADNVLVIDEPDAGQDLLIGLAAWADGYLGRDTGPMHLAAALGKPVIAVFGGGTWPQFIPAAETARVFTMEVPCKQCEWLCHLADSHCVKAVPVEAVTAAIDELQAGSRGECRVTVLARSPELIRQMDREAVAHGREQLFQIGRQRRELAEVRARLADAEERAGRSAGEVRQIQQEFVEANQRAATSQKQLELEYQTARAEVELTVDELRAERDCLRTDLEASETLRVRENESLRAEVSGLTEDLEKAHQQQRRLTEAVANASKEQAILHETLAGVEHQKLTLESQLQKSQEEVGQLNARRVQLRKNLVALQGRLASSQSGRQRLEHQLDQARTERDHLTRKIQSALGQQAHLQTELAKAQVELQTALGQQAYLQAELVKSQEYQSSLLARIDELLSSRWRRLGRKLGVSKPASFERRAS